VLCLGSRIGEEVAAFRELGMDAIGIDLVPCPPLVLEADFHELKDMEIDGKKKFDIVYTNAFDHAWDSELFFSNVWHKLNDNGIFIFDILLNNFQHYEVLYVESVKQIKEELSKTFTLEKKHKRLPQLYGRKLRDVQLTFRKKS